MSQVLSFFFQAEDGIRDGHVTGVQTCALPISFSASTNLNQATPPVEFRWNFGDGTTATGEVPTHSFSTAGTYTVEFVASNRDGRATSTRSCTVTVVAPPAPAEIVTVNASPMTLDVCQPTTMQFSANARGDAPITYEWNFGDGTTGSGANPTHTYSEAGTYTVTLRASNAAERPRARSPSALSLTSLLSARRSPK